VTAGAGGWRIKKKEALACRRHGDFWNAHVKYRKVLAPKYACEQTQSHRPPQVMLVSRLLLLICGIANAGRPPRASGPSFNYRTTFSSFRTTTSAAAVQDPPSNPRLCDTRFNGTNPHPQIALSVWNLRHRRIRGDRIQYKHGAYRKSSWAANSLMPRSILC
jgi:hypothetical protein